MNKKLLILGTMRSGKDTMAEILRDYYGVTFAASSEFASKHFIFEALRGFMGYSSIEECFNDRSNHRDLWFQLISTYNKEDPAKLAKELLQTSDIYVGMRSKVELDTCDRENVFDLKIYVDARERLDYTEPKSSNQITPEDADLIIYNNGTEAEFVTEVQRFYEEYILLGLNKESEKALFEVLLNAPTKVTYS